MICSVLCLAVNVSRRIQADAASIKIDTKESVVLTISRLRLFARYLDLRLASRSILPLSVAGKKNIPSYMKVC